MNLIIKGTSYLILSFVIITYNDGPGLHRTLRFIAAQRVPAHISTEVIVIDDGSSHPQRDTIAEYAASLPRLTYKYRPRDSASCRAIARNMGAELAAGDILIFLDSGVMISPDFAALVADRFRIDSEHVLVHEVLGLNRIPGIDASPLDEASPHTLHEIAALLKDHEHWADSRAGIFRTTGNDLNKLPAPWSLGWTAALSLAKLPFVKAGGFDSTIIKWGSEDTDLCCRLHRNGIRFYAEREAYAIHYPHPADTATNEQANFLNRRALHRKVGNLHTEIYPYYPDTLLNQAVSQWERLAIKDLLPQYPATTAAALRAYADSSSRSLLIGSDDISFIDRISPTTLLVPHTEDARFIRNRVPGLEIYHLLGIDTPFESESFDIVIITDYIRLFPPCLRGPLLNELTRVAKRVLCLYTPDYVSAGLPAGLWPWWDMQGSPLKSQSLSPLTAQGGSIIYEITEYGRSLEN